MAVCLKPKAVATAHVCSVCGLNWEKHGKNASLEDCVELLKLEVARLRRPIFGKETTGKTYAITNVGKLETSPELKEA